MRRIVLLASGLVLAMSVSGCRYKGWESFTSATEPNPAGPSPVKGDPYGFGGVGAANGGLKPQTNYGAGADVNSKGPVNPAFDQPAKGSGQQAGEQPNVAAPGFGQDNGAGLQPMPGVTSDAGPLAHG